MCLESQVFARHDPAMTASAVDILAAARDLETASMDRAQAEAVASAIRAGQGAPASKSDLRAEINGAVIKMMLAQIAFAGVPFAALKLL